MVGVIVAVLLLLLLLGATYVSWDLIMIWKNFKSVDTSEIRYCAKYQPCVTNICAKNGQNLYCAFLRFCVFCFLTIKFKNEIKI